MRYWSCDVCSAGMVAASRSGEPAATRGGAVVVGADVPAAAVQSALVDGAGALLESARLVDDYRGPGVPEARKSLTFALRFRAPDRTLTAAEATEAKRSEERRVGKECVSPCSSRGSPYH